MYPKIFFVGVQFRIFASNSRNLRKFLPLRYLLGTNSFQGEKYLRNEAWFTFRIPNFLSFLVLFHSILLQFSTISFCHLLKRLQIQTL